MKPLHLLLALLILSSKNFAQRLETLTNQNVVAMNQAKVSRSLIVEKINTSTCRFDVSITGLLSLKSVKLSESIIEAMLAVSKPTDVMQNEQVIQLYQAGYSRSLIVQRIQAGPTRFNVNADGVIQLKTARIPEPIIKVMMNGGSPTPLKAETANHTTPTAKTSTPAKKPLASEGPNVVTSDCNTWHDQFTKKSVRASRVTLRGMKIGATVLNSVVGRGSANAFGIEDMEVHLIFRRDGDDLTLVLYASKPGVHTMYVSSDKPLMFLMEDESVMEFLPAEHSESDFSWGSGYSMESEMLMYYRLSAGQARTLTSKLIKEYRLNFYNRKYAQDKVNQNRASQVRSAAQCVVNS